MLLRLLTERSLCCVADREHLVGAGSVLEVSNGLPMDERTPLVEAKLKNFMASFHDKARHQTFTASLTLVLGMGVRGKMPRLLLFSSRVKVQIIDLRTGAVIVKDKMFQKRYACAPWTSHGCRGGSCTAKLNPRGKQLEG